MKSTKSFRFNAAMTKATVHASNFNQAIRRATKRTHRQSKHGRVSADLLDRYGRYPAPGDRPSSAYGYGILNPYRAVTEQLANPRPAAVGAAAGAAAGAVAPLTGPGPAGSPPARGAALVVALIGILLAGLIALAANVLPRGTTRGWRPGGP